jgi:hypothetical protein
MMACDPARNVMFVPAEDLLVVVDCSVDTVAAEIELPDYAADLVGYDPVDNRIYVVHEESG